MSTQEVVKDSANWIPVVAVGASVVLSALVSMLTSRFVSVHQKIDMTRYRRDKLFERRLAAADALSPHFARLLYLVNRVLCLSQGAFAEQKESINRDKQILFNEMLAMTSRHLHVLPPSTNSLLNISWAALWDLIDNRFSEFECGQADAKEVGTRLDECWAIRENLLKEAWFILDVLEDEEARRKGALVKKEEVKPNITPSNAYLRGGDRERMLAATSNLSQFQVENSNTQEVMM